MPVNRDPEPDPETRDMIAEAYAAIFPPIPYVGHSAADDRIRTKVTAILSDLCLKVRRLDNVGEWRAAVDRMTKWVQEQASEVSDLRERLETAERETEKTREREWTAIQVAIRLERERDEVAADLREKGARLAEALRSAQAGCWDGFYGKGLAVAYVQSVDSQARAALSSWESGKSEG